MAKAVRSPADALGAVPPREFVRARNALAAQLAKQGKPAAAREVGRLRRPSPVVWALNRAVVSRPGELNALVQAADRLRRAQLGQGELRTATEHYRATFDAVVRQARETLQDTGSGAGLALERRMRSTLLAAVTDRRLRGELAAGRLVDEQADPGFAVLSQGPIPANFLRDRPAKTGSTPTAGSASGRGAAPRTAGLASSGTQKRKPTEARRRTRQASRDARRVARQAAREIQALNRIARRAERLAQAAERAVAALRRTLQDTERRSGDLRAAADRAREAYERAAARSREAADRVE